MTNTPNPVTTPSPTGLPPVTGSLAFAHGPAARALQELALAGGYKGLSDLRLLPDGSAQAEFVDWVNKHLDEIPQLRDMTSLASYDWQVLNNFLQSHGFAPLFTEFHQPDLGVTSILQATMRWRTAGTHSTIYRTVNGKQTAYPAFKLSNPDAFRQQLRNHAPFTERVLVETQSGHTIYLGMLPEDMEGPRDGAELLKLARTMVGGHGNGVIDEAGIIVPMVNFDTVNELDWLNGLVVDYPDTSSDFLTQCRQHVKFYMNRDGARVEAAFGAVASRGMAPKPQQPYVIDRHFVLAILDGTTTTAVFYLHPDDSWAEPPAGVIQ